MEIIQLTSYTRDEKIEIAKNFLLPKQMEINGLNDISVSFRGNALKSLVDHYTREVGVCSLERVVGVIYRKIA
jgi:ATP-dependent Lon protease